ncbi:hypothetical protein ACFFRR_010383 [Megaselia abdita]
MTGKHIELTFQDLINLSFTNPTGSSKINTQILQNVLKMLVKKMDLECAKFHLTGIQNDEIQDLFKNHTQSPIEVQECTCKAPRPVELVEVEEKETKTSDTVVTKTLSHDSSHFSSVSCANIKLELFYLNSKVDELKDEIKVQNENMKNKVAKICNTENLDIFDLYKDTTIALPGDEGNLSSDCEDLCDPCEPCNQNACGLLNNRDFLKKLMRKTTTPVVDRMFQFEDRIRILTEKFEYFLDAAEKEYQKIPLVEDALFRIDVLKKDFIKHQTLFLRTMEEIQEMLDDKVQKVHIPPMKQWIQDEFDCIWKVIKELKTIKECPKALGTVIQHLKCLSCQQNTCAMKGTQMLPLFHESHAGKNPNDAKQHGRVCYLCCMPRIPGKDYKDLSPVGLTNKDKIDFIQGENGTMYRADIGKKTCNGK